MKNLSKGIRVTAVCVVVFLTSLTPLQAEIVYLKNKKTVEGSISGQTSTSVILRIPGKGRAMMIPKTQIARIRYVSMTDEEKAAKEEKARKIREARRLRRERLERELQARAAAEAEKERRRLELEAQERAEKLAEAKERAERAAALRELVDKGKMEKPEDEPISYMDFAWRSMVLPGWGHFYLDRPVVGSLYAGGAAFLLQNAYFKRQGALEATAANHEQVLNNFILTAVPDVAPLPFRVAYSVDSNRRAFREYKKAVDEYNYSLYMLEVFYAVQLIHIIYNGIAWEEGLFIVDEQPADTIRVHFAVAPVPDQQERGQTTLAGTVGITYSF